MVDGPGLIVLRNILSLLAQHVVVPHFVRFWAFFLRLVSLSLSLYLRDTKAWDRISLPSITYYMEWLLCLSKFLLAYLHSFLPVFLLVLCHETIRNAPRGMKVYGGHKRGEELIAGKVRKILHPIQQFIFTVWLLLILTHVIWSSVIFFLFYSSASYFWFSIVIRFEKLLDGEGNFFGLPLYRAYSFLNSKKEKNSSFTQS